MKDDYLIIRRDMLPDYFGKVMDVSKLLEDGKAANISEAIKIVGISRSTYYKYKDHVFILDKEKKNIKKVVFSLLLNHEKGVLSKALTKLSDMEASVITIMQNPPIGSNAIVILSIDISAVEISMDQMLKEIGSINGVIEANLLDIG